MQTAYKRFSWGILWILLDIRVDVFDVLPDFVGYALLWSAINKAGQLRVGYYSAKPYAIALTILAAADVFLALSDAETVGAMSIMPLAYGSLTQFLVLLLASRFIGALAGHASAKGATALAETLHSRWRTIFVLTSAALLIVPFLFNLPQYFAEFGTMLASIFGIITMLVLFFTCRRAAKEAPLSEP